MKWSTNVDNLFRTMTSLSAHNRHGEKIDRDIAYRQWQEDTMQIRANKKTVYLIGNGASASMASHMAADLAKNAHVHTEVFSDLSLITAISNDLSFEEVFAEPLRRRMKRGDMLVAISSSGRSPNILRAAEAATTLGGIAVTLSAMDVDNPLRAMGEINWHVPADTYGMAETCHAAILHHWMDLVSSATQRETTDSIYKTIEFHRAMK